MGIGATAVAALLAILERPSTWLLGLVGFLVRGGWLIVLGPIVVLPTAVGLANVVAPLVEDIAFGRRSDEVITAGLISSIVVLVWLIGGGLLAAAAEVEGVSQTLAALGAHPRRGPLSHPVWRVLAVRSLTLIPLVVALAWSGFRLISVGYQELTLPSDVAIPIAYRILAGAPDAVVAMLLTWLFAEIVGGLAVRRVVIDGAGVRHAVRRALRDLRRTVVPLTLLALVSAVVLVVAIGVTGLGVGHDMGCPASRPGRRRHLARTRGVARPVRRLVRCRSRDPRARDRVAIRHMDRRRGTRRSHVGWDVRGRHRHPVG